MSNAGSSQKLAGPTSADTTAGEDAGTAAGVTTGTTAGEDAGHAPRQRPPILVVDDEPFIREFIDEMLRDEGYEVFTAPDGRVALELARAHQPGAILLDMKMPVMNGWEFAQAYRQLPLPHAPIVTMTAAQDARRWAAEIHATDVLPKPFDVADLLATLDRLLGP